MGATCADGHKWGITASDGWHVANNPQTLVPAILSPPVMLHRPPALLFLKRRLGELQVYGILLDDLAFPLGKTVRMICGDLKG
jgi:hypothetical protein